MPCNNCQACLMNDCGGCKFCLDKRKFGGPGKLKKRCELRVCMTPRKMGAPSPKTPMANGNKLQLDVRNKFLTTNNQNRQPQIKIIENPPMQTENRAALENIIEMGLETYEVVNVNIVPQDAIQIAGQKPCYICKRDNKEDLFYCSVCCDPFHQFCLHIQAGSDGGTSTCGRCSSGKEDYEQAMIARADSIHAKCEEIDGAQYQVISFLTDAETLKMPDMILQVEEEEQQEIKRSLHQASSQLPSNNVYIKEDNNVYDNDFDAYLHTISLASE